MFRLQGLKEWYARFRGRKFYSRVRKVYQRSKEITTKKYAKFHGKNLPSKDELYITFSAALELY